MALNLIPGERVSVIYSKAPDRLNRVYQGSLGVVVDPAREVHKGLRHDGLNVLVKFIQIAAGHYGLYLMPAAQLRRSM